MNDEGSSRYRDGFTQACWKIQEILPALAGEIFRLREQLDRPLSVAVVGEYSSGKSTFLNAMLGVEVLPTGIKPTTSCVTRLRHGSTPSVVFHYSDGSSRSRQIDSLQTEGHHGSAGGVAIDHIDVFLPSPLLAKSLILVDTPGLNAPNARDAKLTRDILQHSDVIIWLTGAQQIFSGTELDTLKQHEQRYRNKSICIISQVDRLNDPEEEVPILAARAEQMLGDYFKAIVPLSAWQALQGDSRQLEPLNTALWGDIVPRSKDIVAEGLILDAKDLLEAEVVRARDELERVGDVNTEVHRFMETFAALTQAHIVELGQHIDKLKRELGRIRAQLSVRILSELVTWQDTEPYEAIKEGVFWDDQVIKYRTIQRWHWPYDKANSANKEIESEVNSLVNLFFKSAKSINREYINRVTDACHELSSTARPIHAGAHEQIQMTLENKLLPRLASIWSDFLVWFKGYTRASLRTGNLVAVCGEIFSEYSTTKTTDAQVRSLLQKFMPMDHMQDALSEDQRGYTNRLTALRTKMGRILPNKLDVLIEEAPSRLELLQETQRVFDTL